MAPRWEDDVQNNCYSKMPGLNCKWGWYLLQFGFFAPLRSRVELKQRGFKTENVLVA